MPGVHAVMICRRVKAALLILDQIVQKSHNNHTNAGADKLLKATIPRGVMAAQLVLVQSV